MTVWLDDLLALTEALATSLRRSVRLSRKTCFRKATLVLPYQAWLEREARKSVPVLLLKEVLQCSDSRFCFLV